MRNKKKYFLIIPILLIFILISLMFLDIFNRHKTSSFFEYDVNNIDGYTIKGSKKEYLYIPYNKKKGYLQKYFTKNNYRNVNDMVSVISKKENNETIKDGITIFDNYDKMDCDNLYITINSNFQTVNISNGYKINSKNSNFLISVNDKNIIYTGGFRNNYTIEIIRKYNYILLYIYEFETTNELYYYSNLIKR